jgi:hypothetical protein
MLIFKIQLCDEMEIKLISYSREITHILLDDKTLETHVK